MSTQRYATDLTDTEWALIEPFLPAPPRTGRPRRHPWRTPLNAIFYQLRTCGAWRFLPREWPPWQTVYHYFRAFRLDGTWERIHTALRERLRVHLGPDAQPSAGSIDSQSVKTTDVGGVRGFDAGKQVKGRKRHLLGDTEGLVLTVTVHAADIMDRDGVKLLLGEAMPITFPRLRHIWLDAGYNSKGKGKDWIEQTFGWTAQIVAPSAPSVEGLDLRGPSGRPDRLVQVPAAARLSRVAQTVGRRADLRMASSEPTAQQGL